MCVITITATVAVITAATTTKTSKVNENDESIGDISTASTEVAQEDNSVLEPVPSNNEENNNEEPEVVVYATDYELKLSDCILNSEKTNIDGKEFIKTLIIRIDNKVIDGEDISYAEVTIEENAFQGFTALEEVRIFTSNVTIKAGAFKDSKSIYKLTLNPDTVIENGAFCDNVILVKITYYDKYTTCEEINEETFNILYYNYLSKSNLNTYKNITKQVTIFEDVKLTATDVELLKGRGYSVSYNEETNIINIEEPAVEEPIIE